MTIARTVTKSAGVLLLALASMVLFGAIVIFVLIEAGVPVACGGQCTSPYSLQVDFRPETSLQADSALVRDCSRHVNGVVSTTAARPDPNGSGQIDSVVQTVEFGGPEAKPLIRCLEDSPLVEAAGYPD